MGENYRQTLWSFRPHNSVDRANGFFQDGSIEKQQGIERLVLGRGTDLGLSGKRGEELADFAFAHFLRMAFIMKENEPLTIRRLREDKAKIK
jgi:hypothetical protein